MHPVATAMQELTDRLALVDLAQEKQRAVGALHDRCLASQQLPRSLPHVERHWLTRRALVWL